MASTETRPSFRLPWSTGPAESDELPEPPVESIEGSDGTSTEDAGYQHEGTAQMIEQAVPDEPPALDEHPGASRARRATAFMAELSHAMQAAAEHARSETMARFEIEAKSVVDEITAGATTEAAELRRKADDDIAAIRDWSKAEIARVRETTEERIAARKSGLEQELDQHSATVQARTERVGAVMASYEAQMAAFFERLSAEEDPTRIATLAETMPDPPSLADVAASIASTPALLTVVPEPTVETEPGSTEPGTAEAEHIDFAAAEAEAAMFSPDVETDDQETATPEENPETVDEMISEVRAEAELAETTTRVVVSGLVSVANIAAFKRGLGRIAGVSTIGVASGREGEFVFNVTHGMGPDLAGSISAMPGFDVEITSDTGDVIVLTARDRDGAA
jgi:hypothetical protein